MSPTKLLSPALAVASLCISLPTASSSAAAPQSTSVPSTSEALSQVPVAVPVPIGKILAAKPFILEQGYESDWRAERPIVRSGWLLVIEADRATARPRQTAMPVLFVGDQIAERLNDGGPAPDAVDETNVRLVVVVPAGLGKDGAVLVPLKDRPAFFGSAMLPEQVDAHRATMELEAAVQAGLVAPSPEAWNAAAAKGGDVLRVRSRTELMHASGALVRQWSPTEHEQADLLEGRALEGDPDPAKVPSQAPVK